MRREKLTGASRIISLVVDPRGTAAAPDGNGTGTDRNEAVPDTGLAESFGLKQ